MKIKRNILLNPGPATTTDTVKQALMVADICPREKEFTEVIQEVHDGLLKVVKADEAYGCVLFTGSGTAVMDAVINSVVPLGKKILVINNGTYGERMAKIARSYQINCVEAGFEWTRPPDVAIIENTLRADEDITHVAVVHLETTTGLLNPLQELCEAARQLGREVIVDAISSYAGIPIDIKKYGIDYLLSTANKCIQGMPGISFVICKKTAVAKTADIPPRSFYLNLYQHYRHWTEHRQMAFTPAVQVIYALRQALHEYFDEKAEGRHKRYSDNWHVLTGGIRKLGFEFLLPESLQSPIITAIKYPTHPNFDFETLHDMLYARRFTIYPGKIGYLETFRIANIGAINTDDIQDFLEALDNTLQQMGVELKTVQNVQP